jgi:hypothetical protein
MSVEFLVNHAILNAWCNPEQDLQSIVEPKRITRAIGVWNDFEAGKTTYELPDKTSRFHVFQIGQLSPALMGLMETHGLWALAADTCHQKRMVIDVYTQYGIQFPRTQTWYMVTKNRNLLFAVKEVPSIPVNLRTEGIFLRVYTNAFFQSRRAGVMVDDIRVTGKYIAKTDDVLALQNLCTAWQQLPGGVIITINGMKVSHLNLFSAPVGAYVELLYDSSIRTVIDFPLKDLRAFNSVLDNKAKYLLHYANQGAGMIDYHDDIDVFLVHKNPTRNRHKGVYYHRNAPNGDAVRMVTHKDYAIPTDYVNAYLASQPAWPVDEVMVRLHVRYSGYARTLVDEANRIKELYKMEDADISEALLSIDSVVDNWTAATLENSAYAAVMRASSANMDLGLVQDAYGYNAISKIMADSPLFTKKVTSKRVIDLGYGLQVRSAAYEYDDNGLLLGYYQHSQGNVYVCRSDSARLVEMAVGTLGTRLDDVYGEATVAIDETADYRFYTCGIEFDGTVNNHWVDVTGTDKYSILAGVVHWQTNPLTTYTLVRSNKNILAYGLDLNNASGVLRFPLTQLAFRGGNLTNRVMEIPMGELDVFLNQHSLIEGVDYYVNFPEIVITNKLYLKPGNNQHVDVRFTGFCKSDLSREEFKEKGFIDHGLLSANNRFDIRDDKVQRIIVAGSVYGRQELLFAEDDLAVQVPDVKNGMPYWIRDVVVPLRGIALDDTYALRDKALPIDAAVSGYLTSKLPQRPANTPNTIKDLYPVVSPFCARILFDLKNGIFTDPLIQSFYGDADVFNLCQPYEYLLAFDPTQDSLRPDPTYVAIHPHHLNTVVDVDLYQYKFLTRVVKLYLKDRVSLTNFVRIST